MNTRPKFRSVFPGDKPVILIVVHVVNDAQTQESVLAAREGGADGCFLICHSQQGPAFLRAIARDVRGSHPDWWIGLNFLKQTPFVAATFCDDLGGVGDGPVPRANGLWVDNSLAIYHHAWRKTYHLPFPGFLDTSLPESPLKDSLFFAGAAFKHQDFPGFTPEREARIVQSYCDVVTTSGPATGMPASIEKIRGMREAMDASSVSPPPLAIASGVSAENVRSYLPWATCFLVASSVTDPGERTSRDKVRELVQAAKS